MYMLCNCSKSAVYVCAYIPKTVTSTKPLSTYTVTSTDKQLQVYDYNSYNYNPSLDQSYDLCFLLQLLSTPLTLLAPQEASHSKKQENHIDLRTCMQSFLHVIVVWQQTYAYKM